jgi:Putative flagellar system-associated repeat
MKLRRKLGVLAVTAVMGASLAVVAAGTASAAGRPGLLEVVGPCGDLLDMIERVQGTLVVDITVPSSDPNEVWSLTAFEQEFGQTTGARVGAPVNLVPNPMPQLAFSPAEGGFTTTMNFTDNPGATHGFFYTATRTSPTPETCTSQGFRTTPTGGTGPDPSNPTGKPDSAPVPTNVNEADRGTHTVAMQFDQEMLASSQGIPVASRFSATVNGVNRAVTAVSVSDDNPPNKAVVTVTLAGAVLARNAVVAVSYRQPLSSSDPQLQDLDSQLVVGFTQSVTVF